MPYAVTFRPSAARELKKLPRNIQARILPAIAALAENPRPHEVEKLTDRIGLRIRVGDYRVVYTVDDGNLVVEIIRVADRKAIYHWPK